MNEENFQDVPGLEPNYFWVGVVKYAPSPFSVFIENLALVELLI